MILEMNKKKRKPRHIRNLNMAVIDVWQRQLGQLSARAYEHRRTASEDLVLRLDIYKKLENHHFVNTVSFNSDGDVMISGSNNRQVKLWDWETGKVKLSFHSGHLRNVFEAKILPFSDNRSIVTCAADGQVRHAEILERGVESSLLGNHQGQAHKVAMEPGSPRVFYTCGEDGLVQHFDLRTAGATRLFICRPLKDRLTVMPVVHLNTIAIDRRNPNLFAVAGSDEYSRLYDIRKYKWDASSDFGQPMHYFCPPHLINDKEVGITGLAFSNQSELLASYNDGSIHLFTQSMGLGQPHPPLFSPKSMGAEVELIPQVFHGHLNCATVKGVNFLGPGCEYVVSGSDCGRIFIWKKKGGELIRIMEADNHVVSCIESHPHVTVLASCGLENGIKIWTPNVTDRAVLPTNITKVRPNWKSCYRYPMASPTDMLLQLASIQRGKASHDRSDENFTAGHELLDFLLKCNVSSDDSWDNLSPEDMYR